MWICITSRHAEGQVCVWTRLSADKHKTRSSFQCWALKSSNIMKRLQYNYVCFFFPLSILTPSDPSCESRGGQNHQRRVKAWWECMERNKHGGGGRCVLTVGMFASLGVIKRYPTLPPPQVIMLISKLEGSLNQTQDPSPRATCQTKATPWKAMRMTGGVLSLFNFVDLWANEKAAHGSEASPGHVMSFWLINLKLSFSPRAIKKHQIKKKKISLIGNKLVKGNLGNKL